MADVLTPAQRRRNMRAIRGADTKPEMVVRRLVHAMGYRYRLHDRSLPGSPDLVLARHDAVIFVHGCFWHRHRCANGQVVPATRRQFWLDKLEGNRRRDASNRRKLHRLDWRVLVIWECQLRNPDKVADRIERFLG